MASSKPPIALSGLARRLVKDNLITEDTAHKALAEAKKKKIPFISHLVKEKKADSRAIAMAASQEFGVPAVDLEALDITQAPVTLVEEKLIRAHHALPVFQRGKRLFLAVSDPTNLQGLDEIKFHTGLGTEAIVVEEEKLAAAIEAAMRAQESSIADMVGSDLDNLDVEFAQEDEKTSESDAEIDEAPIVKFVNKVLLDAINKGASDLHFEPYEKAYRLRFRIDGMLHEVASPPVQLGPRLAARLKVMSNMNLAEKRVPQDGRIKMVLSKNRAIDFRVNTLPTLYGEKICMRILDPTSADIGIEALGFEEEQRKAFESNIAKPYGMILVTGPTGSGKTVTLYTGLNMINTETINISTAEDPVEIQVFGINQVPVNAAIGLDFAAALRAFLRQDPDVVMVGEIRDLETAEISIKAAQTGHLVFSTLHTNDAPQTLTRLMNMGVPPFNIASAVNLIMAQRLARRLCKNCKKTVDIPREALLEEGFTEDEVDDLKVYAPVGCDKCTEGYKGRVGIYQVMPISEAMSQIIMNSGTSLELAAQAEKEGISDLRKSGLKKVKDGVTSLQELNRVTKE